MENSVKQRLLIFLREKKIGQSRFEKMTGLSNGYLSKLRHSPSTDKLQDILSTFPELNRTWLLTGEGDMLNYENEKKQIDSSSPAFDLATIQGGIGHGTGSEQFMAKNAVGIMAVPGIPVGEGTPYIQVRGSSMVNRRDPAHSIPEGAWIGLRPAQSSVIRWGEVYAIMTNDGPVVKKVMPGNDAEHITLVSYNEEDGYLPYELPTDEIIYPLYHIVAIVTAKTW